MWRENEPVGEVGVSWQCCPREPLFPLRLFLEMGKRQMVEESK